MRHSLSNGASSNGTQKLAPPPSSRVSSRAGVMLGHAAQQHRAGIVAPRQRQIGARGDLGHGATADHAPRLDQHQRFGQPGHFVQRVRHVDHRQAQRRFQPRQIGQDLRLARGVQAGQRFVHQQQVRLRQQRPADRHALALAAGQRVRPARQQRADAKQFDHLVESTVPGEARRMPKRRLVATDMCGNSRAS